MPGSRPIPDMGCVEVV